MWITLKVRKGGGGSKDWGSLPIEKAVPASLFLCRGSRGGTEPPGCLLLPRHHDAQRVHDEKCIIRTYVREGKSCVGDSKAV